MLAVLPRNIPPACASDPDLPFRADNPGADPQDMEKIRELCAECPIYTACLQIGLQYRDMSGVWGGLTSRERGALRSKLGINAKRQPPLGLPTRQRPRGERGAPDLSGSDPAAPEAADANTEFGLEAA